MDKMTPHETLMIYKYRQMTAEQKVEIMSLIHRVNETDPAMLEELMTRWDRLTPDERREALKRFPD